MKGHGIWLQLNGSFGRYCRVGRPALILGRLAIGRGDMYIYIYMWGLSPTGYPEAPM